MSAARYSGTGAQAASVNSARSPAANACRNFIGSREMAGRRRIPMLRRTSPGPTLRSRALCSESDRGGFVPTRRQDFCGQWSATGGSPGRRRTGHKQRGADVLTFLPPFFPSRGPTRGRALVTTLSQGALATRALARRSHCGRLRETEKV